MGMLEEPARRILMNVGVSRSDGDPADMRLYRRSRGPSVCGQHGSDEPLWYIARIRTGHAALAGDESSYLTGEESTVDGGLAHV